MIGIEMKIENEQLSQNFLGSSNSDFARDPMDLGPCFLIFSRDLVDFY